MARIWDVECAIIGGGPGGWVSALYMRRYRRSVVLFQHGKPRAAWIPRTHNLMGFPQGISGAELLRRLHRQVGRLGVELLRGQAAVKRFHGGFQVQAGGQTVTTRKVILATGMEDVQPALENLNELRESGLLRYCPICDAYDFREKRVAVLARDDAGVQRALFMARFARRLGIVIPEELQLAPQRVREIRACGANVFRGNTFRIERTRHPRGLWIDRFAQRPVFVHVAYVELGARPLDFAYRGLHGLKRSRAGFPLTTIEQRCSIPGLFAVGDCTHLLGQISVAAGQAAVAATTAHNDLEKER